MPMLQRFGELLESPFFRNEEGRVEQYDPSLIVKGQPLPGDGVVYDVTERGRVTKIWLMKCLDDSKDNDIQSPVTPQQRQRDHQPRDLNHHNNVKQVQNHFVKPVPAPRPNYTAQSMNNHGQPIVKARPSSNIPNHGSSKPVYTVQSMNTHGQPIVKPTPYSTIQNHGVTDHVPAYAMVQESRKVEAIFNPVGLASKQRIPEIYQHHERQSRIADDHEKTKQSRLNAFANNQIDFFQQETPRKVPNTLPSHESFDQVSNNFVPGGDTRPYQTLQNSTTVNKNGTFANSEAVTKPKTTTPQQKSKPNGKQQTGGVKEQPQQKQRMQYQGKVVRVIRKDDGSTPFGFIRCEELLTSAVMETTENEKQNDIFFSYDAVQSNLLDLKQHDEVEFRIFVSKKSGQKPKAANVMILVLANRTLQELLDYVNKIKAVLTPTEENPFGNDRDYFYSSDSKSDIEEQTALQKASEYDPKQLMKLLSSPAVWQNVAKQVAHFSNSDHLLEKFIEILLSLHEQIRTSQERFRQILIHITGEVKFFNPVRGRFRSYIDGMSQHIHHRRELIQKFLLIVAKMVPKKQSTILSFIKPLMDHPDGETAKFLYQILKLLTSGSVSNIDDLDWKELPLILKTEEIFNPDLTNATNLKAVVVQGAYKSVDDYVDVYFRLLREDCFHKLKKSIQDLVSGKLDIRDMNVYRNIALVGIALKENALYMALKITSVKEIRDWETCPNLMFGNLLCISISGNFQQPIWVTVSNREMLKKDSVIVVQSCWEWNDTNDAEILLNLITAKGDVYMVESPTYYRAFQPVLKTLQSLDINNICFHDELIDLKPGQLSPFLHAETCDFDATIAYKNPAHGRMTLNEFFRTRHSENSIFDPYQEHAVKTCLQNRIGIIQGPPGCGKTFIGIKMIRILLSLSSLADPTILVLTYKNHALDEFLKGIMRHVEGEKVVRLGGRSRDEELDAISLQTIRKKCKKSPEIWNQIQALYGDIDEAKKNIDTEFRALEQLRSFSYDRILEELSPEQMTSLLTRCDWDSMKVQLNFGQDVDGTGFQKQKKKGAKQTKMTNDKVAQILESGAYNFYQESFQKLKYEALKAWLPPKAAFDEFENALIGKRMHVKLNLNTKGKQDKKNAKKEVGEDDHGFYDVQDEQEIEEEQNERMAALTKPDFNVKSDFHKSLIMVDYKEADDAAEKDHTVKAFSSAALDKIEETMSGIITLHENLWEIELNDRVQFVQKIIAKQTSQVRANFQSNLQTYEELCKQKTELENQHTAQILRAKRIVGVTITGASINQSLLKEIQPEIVLVEEAAEVLEPQLLASIGTWTKYMLMIGDHQQLRPPVDTYHLRKDYNFDISMMERLINNNLPYSTLKMQNRQRAEFADLLMDIYGDLRTNQERVKDNHPAKCLAKSVFFWHHTENETKDRSVTNKEEAIRAVKLALFLVQQGYAPDKVTVLATYRGQTALIRKTMREYEKKFQHVIKTKDDIPQITRFDKGAANKNGKEETTRESVKIHTVDMYQGDENDFVIVSLVRSNAARKIGFLKEKNRRCVAQSRARCGVYFIGNADMFTPNSTWRPLMTKLKDRGCVGDALEIICQHHPKTPFPVKNADMMTLGPFCKQPCMCIMSCGRHRCRKLCQPPHSHKPCPENVQFQHLTCGHSDTKKCEEDAEKKKCQTDMKFYFNKCGHPGQKKCFEDISTIKCEFEVHTPLSCGHTGAKKCYENVDGVKCQEPCAQVRACGHRCHHHKCFEHATKLQCADCERLEKEKKKKQLEAEEKQRKQNKAKVEEEIKKIQQEARKYSGVSYIELKKSNETLSRYLDVEDAVKKFIQPGHNWYPTVTKIEEVKNPELRVRFLKKSMELFDPEPVAQWKFHGTDNAGVKGITETGFRLPAIAGMYGAGIYLATDSSKSAQAIYTKGSNKLLYCEVYLGKAKTVDKAAPRMDAKTLNALRCDSLFAPRDTKGTGGVLFDEFVVFEPSQVFPRFIVSYSLNHFQPGNIPIGVDFTQDFRTGKKIMTPSRQVDIHNPLESHFSFVESRFLRMLSKQARNYEITKIEFYNNPTLEKKFKQKEAEFKRQYAGQPEALPIYGFHGTKNDQIVDNIMNNNFRPSAGGKFGAGVYFSEQPAYTFGYGGENHLIMARILPGKTVECRNGMGSALCTQGYDSHGGFKQLDGTFHEVVIFNTDQILPCYVIYFK